MLKQSPNRNQRTKGFKVIQGFKIFTLIAVGIWLLYQLKHYYSHDKNKSYEEISSKKFEKLKVGHETNILGRKGFQLQPWINKAYELNDEIEESIPERVMERSSTGGGNDQDRVEEEEEPDEEGEDLIGEEDKQEEEENEEMEEDTLSLLEDQGHNEGEKDTQATT